MPLSILTKVADGFYIMLKIRKRVDVNFTLSIGN